MCWLVGSEHSSQGTGQTRTAREQGEHLDHLGDRDEVICLDRVNDDVRDPGGFEILETRVDGVAPARMVPSASRPTGLVLCRSITATRLESVIGVSGCVPHRGLRKQLVPDEQVALVGGPAVLG